MEFFGNNFLWFGLAAIVLYFLAFMMQAYNIKQTTREFMDDKGCSSKFLARWLVAAVFALSGIACILAAGVGLLVYLFKT